MDMKRINSGKLRSIGYDAATRRLRVQFDDGAMLEYEGVDAEVWRRLSQAGSPWSVFRDNIEEEFTGRRIAATDAPAGQKKNPLDDLFN